MTELFYVVPVAGIIALIFAFILSSRIEKVDAGTDRMKEIASYIQEGAMAFLTREYRSLAVFMVVLFFALTFLIDWQTAVCFIVGGAILRHHRLFWHAGCYQGQCKDRKRCETGYE